MKKNEAELSNTLNVTYVNKHGETMILKVDKDWKTYINHNDIHEKDEFYPLEVSLSENIFNDGEKAIIHSFVLMVIKNKEVHYL